MGSLKKSIQGSWRGTDENKSWFLQRRNLKEQVILESKIIDSIFFIFLFYFILFSIFIGLRINV